MRRGTEAAELFGSIINVLRTEHAKKSMRAMGIEMGVPASTVSQVEKAQRALKEHKLELWASALYVPTKDLTELWYLSQGLVPIRGGKRVFYPDYAEWVRSIYRILDRYVDTLIEIPKIKPMSPVIRRRSTGVPKDSLTELIKTLNSVERSRVQGYIDALIEARGN